MAGAKKKKTIRPPEHDEHMALEDAMNELTRQTDALLSETKKRAPVKKPTLPKQKIVPHRKGAHLDIVGHTPSSPKKIVHPEPVAATPHQELLPEHAGKSFNELPKSSRQIESSDSEKKAEAVIIHSHEGRQVQPLGDSKEHENDTEVAQEKAPTPKKKTVTKPVVHEKINFISPAEEKIDVHGATDHTEKLEDDGIIPLEKTSLQKPTVFDTEEYHSELHDWSKLSSTSRWPIVVLALLVVITIALVYLYSTKQLPTLF